MAWEAIDVEDVRVAGRLTLARARGGICTSMVVCDGIEYTPLATPLLFRRAKEAKLPSDTVKTELLLLQCDDVADVFHNVFVRRGRLSTAIG